MKIVKRKQYEDRLALDSKTASKRLFAYLRKRTRAVNRIPYINSPDGDLEADQSKAEAFAEHYSAVYVDEQSPLPPFNDKVTAAWTEAEITANEVAEYLRLLNTSKSPGPDDIHPLVLKELADILAGPLTVLFNMSLRCGKLPAEWKTATVKPMYKSGSRSAPINYRPVSLTCIASKVMEKIITNRIRAHLEANNLLHPGQHGFRTKRSCVTNLLVARESWVAARSDGKDVDVIFIDFSKAFDKVPHQRLINKLKAYGIHGCTLQWITDFLTGRTFNVKVNGVSSEQRAVKSGVPQGSVLGPTLFLIYINDLLEVIKSPCLLFADDIKIWRVLNDDTDPDILQDDLDQVMLWSRTWQIPINSCKSKYMHIGSDLRTNAYHLDGTLLEITKQEKDLGVVVCNTMKTAAHTEMVCSSAKRMLGAIKRSFCKLSPKAFNVLYAAHIRSRLEYAGSAVYPCTLGEMESIERVQRAATKLVDEVSDLDYEDRLNALNLFPQSYRRVRGDMIMLRHILKGEYGPDLLEFLPLRNDCQRRGHRLTLRKQASGKMPAKFRLSHRAVDLWNSLPANVVEENNDETFKLKLDNHLREMWHREFV